MATPRPRRRARRWWLLGGLAVLVVAVAALALALNSGAVATRLADRVVAGLTQSLGREVSFDRVELGWWPPGAVVRGLQVEGGEAGALLDAAEVRAVVALWPLVRSLGEDVRVSELIIERPTVRLVRTRAGAWEHDDLLARLREPRTEPVPDVVLGAARIEDGSVLVFDERSGGRPALALTAFDAKGSGSASGGELEWKAAFGTKEQNLGGSARLKDGRVTGDVSLTKMPLAPLAAFAGGGAPIRGGELTTKAEFDFAEELRARGTAEISGIGLARGGTGGGSARFDARVDPKSTGKAEGTLSKLRLDLPGARLAGDARIRGRSAHFSLHTELLDLDALEAALPPSSDAKKAPSAPPAITVDGTLRADRVVRQPMQLAQLDTHVRLDRGVVRVERGTATGYGGRLDLAGTTVDVREEKPRWTLSARLDGLDAASLRATAAGVAPITGKLGGQLRVSGRGTEWSDVQRALTGAGAFAIEDGSIRGFDLKSELQRSLAKAGLAAAPAETPALTKLDHLQGSFTVANGQLVLSRPLTFDTPAGPVSLTGSVGLDRSLALTGTVEVPPEALASLTSNRIRPTSAVAVPITIGGTITRPALTGVDVSKVASGLVRDELETRARKKLKDLFPGF